MRKISYYKIISIVVFQLLLSLYNNSYVSFLLAHTDGKLAQKNNSLNFTSCEYVLDLISAELVETGLYRDNYPLEKNIYNMAKYYFENYEPPKLDKCYKLLKILYTYFPNLENRDEIINKLIFIAKRLKEYEFLEKLVKKELEKFKDNNSCLTQNLDKKKELLYLWELVEVLENQNKIDEMNEVLKLIESKYTDEPVKEFVKLKVELYGSSTK